MSIFEDVMNGYNKGVELATKTRDVEFRIVEQHVFDYDFGSCHDPHDGTGGSAANTESMLAHADNLEYMKWLLKSGYAGKIKCIYIDPPFFSKAKYTATVNVVDSKGAKHKVRHLAYDDRFERDLEHYIENVTARLLLIKELLAEDGLLWVHLDWHSAHYIKVVMDEIFGQKNFVNEIIWKYKSGGSGKRHFSRKHDTLFLYSKSDKYKLSIPEEKSYNRDLKAYNFKGVKEYRDEYGWYTMVNMKDVWSIDMVGRTSSERTGYATQKPLELMRRIIYSSTEKGELCADFFCGSGSFLAACDQAGRHYIGCDSEELAISMAKKRLDASQSTYMYYQSTEEQNFHPGLAMECTGTEELESGKKLHRFAVKSFVPDIDIGHIPNADRKIVKELIDNDPNSFIDYIMIDPYHHKEFSCEMVVDDNFDEILFLSHGEIAFILVDIFGKEYYYSVSALS